MIGNRQEIASLQSDFYREKYRKMLRLLILSAIVTVTLICCIIYLVLFREQSHYYATTTDGQIIPLYVAKPHG